MAELLERKNERVFVRRDETVIELIDLGNLVHAGTELIWFNARAQSAETIAKTMALHIARENKNDYVLLGTNPLEAVRALNNIPNYVYIATFYNKRNLHNSE